MIRGQKVLFWASEADLDRLYSCNRKSVRVWNECLRLAKEHFLQYGRWIIKSKLQKQTKRKFHLHRQSIQAVCHKYLFFVKTSRTKPSNKDILPAIPTRQRNGRKTISKCMKTGKSNSPWVFITKNEKSRSSCMSRICQRSSRRAGPHRYKADAAYGIHREGFRCRHRVEEGRLLLRRSFFESGKKLSPLHGMRVREVHPVLRSFHENRHFNQ
jgi:hypothetical protein